MAVVSTESLPVVSEADVVTVRRRVRKRPPNWALAWSIRRNSLPLRVNLPATL